MEEAEEEKQKQEHSNPSAKDNDERKTEMNEDGAECDEGRSENAHVADYLRL